MVTGERQGDCYIIGSIADNATAADSTKIYVLKKVTGSHSSKPAPARCSSQLVLSMGFEAMDSPIA